MTHFNHIVFLLTGCLIAGILLSTSIEPNLIFCIFVLAGLFTAVLIYHFIQKTKKSIVLSVGIFMCVVVLGIIVVKIHDPLSQKNHYQNQFSTEKLSRKGTFTLRIKEVLKPNLYTDRYIAQIEKLNDTSLSGKVILQIRKNDSLNNSISKQNLLVDYRYIALAAIDSVNAPRNPHQFDYSNYLRNKGIYGQIDLDNGQLYLLDSAIKTPQGFASRIRSFLQQKLKIYNFDPDTWGVINALLLGQRQEVTQAVNQSYIDAGIIHILAVSGLHVGIVLFLLRFLLKPFGNTRRMRYLRSALAILGVWTFALLTGLSPSVLRAATMFSFLEIGLLRNHRSGGMNGLVTSAFILLLIDPSLINQVGFQLSYVAVFFILWLQPPFYALWKPKNRVLSYFWGIFTVSIVAQLGVLPLSLFHFHQFSGLFFVSNLVILPFLGLILGAGILTLFLAAVGILPPFLAEAFGGLIHFLNRFIFWITQFDSFIFRKIHLGILHFIFAYLILISFCILLKKPNYKRIMLFLIVLFAFATAEISVKSLMPTHRFYILNQYKNSLLAEQKNTTLHVFTDQAATENQPTQLVNFEENSTVNTITRKEIGNYHFFKDKQLLVIDSIGIYTIADAQPDYILLRQSPKINLDRLLNLFPHAQIIADGSNYKTYINRWKVTCFEQKIPFHSTYEKGFFELK